MSSSWFLLPGIVVVGRDCFLEELELVQIQSNQVSRSEDSQQDTETAEQQGVEGSAPRPPGAQTQKHKEVHGRGQRGQHHSWGGRNARVRYRVDAETVRLAGNVTIGDDVNLLPYAFSTIHHTLLIKSKLMLFLTWKKVTCKVKFVNTGKYQMMKKPYLWHLGPANIHFSYQ